MKIICDHCHEELAIWYRVRDLFLCISCKEKDDAKNKTKNFLMSEVRYGTRREAMPSLQSSNA